MRLAIAALAMAAGLSNAAVAQTTEAAVAAVMPEVAPAAGDPAPQATPAAAPTAPAATASDGPIPAPPAGKGQVVFYRSATIIGAAISCAVHEKGAKLSSLPRGRYAVIAADPGIHNYTVQSEAKDTLRLEIEPGETYFAQCSIGMGFMVGRPNLSPSDRGKFMAMSSKLSPVKEN